MPTARRSRKKLPSPPGSAAPTTRERILDAAFRVLAEHGLARLTLRAVADDAHVALGLVNYHFASRQALVLELVAASRARFLGELDTRIEPAPAPHLLRQILEHAAALPAFMPAWFRLNADLDSLALHDPALRDAATSNKTRGASDVRRFFEIVAQVAETRMPEAERNALADVVYAACDGLAIRALLDPSFDRYAAYAEIDRIVMERLAPGMTPHPAPFRTDLVEDLPPARPRKKKRS